MQLEAPWLQACIALRWLNVTWLHVAQVLDAIDAQSSVVVCAPTSAGKTFISYYCMDRVLGGSKDGKVVFVAPTKALVNQVAAQVRTLRIDDNLLCPYASHAC
jgi:ERCC4-related helicase